MRKKSWALAIGLALIMGAVSACSDDQADAPGSGANDSPAGQQEAGAGAGAENGTSAEATAKTCDDFQPDPELAVLWRDAFWANPEGSADCEDEIPGDLRLDLELREGMGYTLQIACRCEREEPAHQVMVSNAQLGGDSQILPLVDAVVQDPAVYSEWLEEQRKAYDETVVEQKTSDRYWERAFGGPVAFEDIWMDASRWEETFEIGPTYQPGVDTQDDNIGRTWYFAIDPPKAPKAALAVKFDLTVDGETKTIAFQL
ncbi:MAG: hypothetical protein LBC97_08390 [Bifidobacteriaceae bacterium]|jgi:hypothetical protein|nr:hypothetical protein [Bifidobacteriaceae bacterium]